MMKKFLTSLSATLLFSGIASAQEETPLDIIPETAVGVVRFDAPDKIKADLSAFINKVQPASADLWKGTFRRSCSR